MWVAWMNSVLGCRIEVSGETREIVSVVAGRMTAADKLFCETWAVEKWQSPPPLPNTIEVFNGTHFDLRLKPGRYEVRRIGDSGESVAPLPAEGGKVALGTIHSPPVEAWPTVVKDELSIRQRDVLDGGSPAINSWHPVWITDGDEGAKLQESRYGVYQTADTGLFDFVVRRDGGDLQRFMDVATARTCAEGLHRQDLARKLRP